MMVAPMMPQGTRLLSLLENPNSETFLDDFPLLLDEFTASITGIPRIVLTQKTMFDNPSSSSNL
jgi:hypothetical protein